MSKHTWKTVGAALTVCLFVVLTTTGCREPASETQLSGRLRLATTTSCDNSGLLEYLLPRFREHTGVEVDVIAVGTGRALRLGEHGDVDAVLVHSPADEEAFVAAGFGVNRRSLMYNEFFIVGPSSDPAGVNGVADVVAALDRIGQTGSKFVSRGDDSGTHRKELGLWDQTSARPTPGEWYLEAGQGMADTLRVASELEGYCLTDIATYLTQSDHLDLEILVRGDERLRNPYSIIAVNPNRHEHSQYLLAMLFIGWLTSPEGVELIGAFEHNGAQLFTPTP